MNYTLSFASSSAMVPSPLAEFMPRITERLSPVQMVRLRQLAVIRLPPAGGVTLLVWMNRIYMD